MLVIGTGGFAVDLLNDLTEQFSKNELVFFNDTQTDIPACIKSNFKVLANEADAHNYLLYTDSRFIVAVGDNHLRETLAKRFALLGGINVSFISKQAHLSEMSGISEKGVIIMHSATISWGIKIQEGTVLYVDCRLGHGTEAGKYCFIGCGSIMSATLIHDYTYVGIGVKFIPGLTFGANCVIGAGSVVTKSFPENSVIMGIPAKLKTAG